MPQISLILKNEVGLHARPAAQFVQTASRFRSDIQVRLGERNANAKSILSVLTLGAGKGAEVVIAAEGQDAADALDTLRQLIESNFGEEASGG